MPVLRNEPSLPLFSACVSMTHEQEEALIEDILNEKVSHLKKWVENGRKRYEILINSPENLAFDALARQPKDWLNEHQTYFEKKFEACLPENENTEPFLAKLKALFAFAQAGVRFSFWDEMREKYRGRLSETLELDMLVLKAKFQEGLDGLVPDKWKKDLLDETWERPHLLTALIYVYREKQPFEALSLLSQWDKQTDGVFHFKPSPELRAYTIVYLRDALWNLLHKAPENVYWEYLQLRYGFQTELPGELLDEALEHELLEDIADACARHELTSYRHRMPIIQDKLQRLDETTSQSN